MAEKEKKKRVRKEYTEAAAPSSAAEKGADSTSVVSEDMNAAAQLRAAREAKGLTLENVASSIHLRVSQIRAIEEGDINHLPGMAYAVGFVRSYANFLKLNSADVVARFKADHGGVTKIKAQLNFPEPMNESRTPSPIIIGVATICVIVLLSVWAIFSGGDDAVENIDTAAVEEQQPIDTLPVETETSVAGEPVTTTTETVIASETPAAEPVVETTAPVTAVAPTTVASQPVVAPAPAPVTTTVVETAPVAAAPVVAAPAKVVETQPAPVAVNQTPVETEEQIVVKPPKTRVVLQANETSWVQVTDAKGAVILKKVMKPGEKFYVPDRANLSLVTSNAGGLAVLVDGEATAELGRDGDIVRNVSLNPETLKARRKTRIRNY